MATGRRTGTGRARPAPAVNTYSAVTVPLPGRISAPLAGVRTLAAAVRRGPAGDTKKAQADHERAQKQLATQQEAGRQTRATTAKRESFEAAGGRPQRADVLPDTPVGHGMSLSQFGAQGMLHAGVSPAHTLDAVRGTSMMADPNRAGTASAGSGDKLARTVVQGTPNINTPHATNPNVTPGRRWEDLHPHEQAKALALVEQHGSSVEKMRADLTSQVLSAHARSGRNQHDIPFSSLFYEGPSQQHSKIEQGADELMAHPRFQASGLDRNHARAMVAVANANTSPNVKFQQGDRYPNHEVAMTVLHHVLNGGDHTNVPTPAEMGQAAYPANIEKAAHHAQQMLGGASLGQLHNLPAPKTGEVKRAFDPSSAPKVTDYAGAWIDPTGPDSRYVSDVHSTHSLMPHLGTAKPVMHRHAETGETKMIVPGEKVPRGFEAQYDPPKKGKDGKLKAPKPKTGKSETEQYLASDKVGLSALHDHIARTVATDLGLSHSVHNAGATHYVQATDWGEEQINRPDITDRTEAMAYGGDARVPARGHDIAIHTPANGRVVGTPSSHRTVHFGYGGGTPAPEHDEDHSWDMGQQKRHENTMAKRRREGRELPVDPEARAQGW